MYVSNEPCYTDESHSTLYGSRKTNSNSVKSRPFSPVEYILESALYIYAMYISKTN